MGAKGGNYGATVGCVYRRGEQGSSDWYSRTDFPGRKDVSPSLKDWWWGMGKK